MISITFHIKKKKIFLGFCPKYFQVILKRGLPVTETSSGISYFCLHRSVAHSSSTHERQHAERHVTDAACIKRFFPAGFIQGSESTCCISITIQPDSYFRLISIFFFGQFFRSTCSNVWAVCVRKQTLAMMPLICIAGIHTYIQHNHNKPIRVQPVSVPVLRGQRGTLDVQGEEIGSGEEWRGEKEGEMKGWFRNSVHLYLRGWEPAPVRCLRERWCPRCWSYHPPRPACAPAGHTHTHPTNTVRGRFIVIRCMFTKKKKNYIYKSQNNLNENHSILNSDLLI